MYIYIRIHSDSVHPRMHVRTICIYTDVLCAICIYMYLRSVLCAAERNAYSAHCRSAPHPTLWCCIRAAHTYYMYTYTYTTHTRHTQRAPLHAQFIINSQGHDHKVPSTKPCHCYKKLIVKAEGEQPSTTKIVVRGSHYGSCDGSGSGPE